MRFVLTGGGTGGHIYPALAIARGLKDKYPEAEVLYIGSENGLEADIVPRSGYSFKSIRLSGLRRKITLENALVIWWAAKGVRKARKLLKNFRPCAVIGTGGYVCGPVVIAASSLRIPTLIHEQNALPGITNRVLSNFAGQVAATFEDSVSRFPARAEVKLTGLPVRPEVLSADRNRAREKLNVKPGQVLVLSFGGSQGARSINRAMSYVLKDFLTENGVKFLHVTGPAQFDEFLVTCRRLKIPLNDESGANSMVVPYMYDMPASLAAADLVVCRAGATTLAEITARGIPGILIPYPYASGNHQEYNARALAEKGAAEMILDHKLDGRILAQKIRSMVGNPRLRGKMAAASLSMGRPRALEDILLAIEKMIT